jgi:hypothetical protein
MSLGMHGDSGAGHVVSSRPFYKSLDIMISVLPTLFIDKLSLLICS